MSIGVEFATREGRLRALLRLLSSIRFDEVLVLQGTPMLGAVFSIGHLTGAKSLALAFFSRAVFVLPLMCSRSTIGREWTAIRGIPTGSPESA